MEVVARQLLRNLATPPILVSLPGPGRCTDNSGPFRLYCDASRDGFCATLEQDQQNRPVRPIVFISCNTLDKLDYPRQIVIPRADIAPYGVETHLHLWWKKRV